MNNYSLSEVFDYVYKQEFSKFENTSKHFFSHRHRKAMKKILYSDSGFKYVTKRNVSLKRRVLIALLVVILMIFGIAAGATIMRGFTYHEHHDNTEIFAVSAENSPKTIESVYYLSVIPNGYKPYEQICDSKWAYASYIEPLTNKKISISQFVKNDYHAHLDNERQTFEQLDINGKIALYLGTDTGGSITLDNGDYVLEIFGCLPKDELILLVKNIKIRSK